MTRKTKYIIVGVSVIAVSAFAYFYYFGIDKQKALDIIASSVQISDTSTLATFDEQFLISWAKAIRILRKTFNYNGKEYSVQTGRSLS